MSNEKYQNIPLGSLNHPQYLQGLVNSVKSAEQKRASQLKPLCDLATVYIDEELDYVDCYYRFVFDCPNQQTDVEERLLKIEVAEKDGEAIHLNDWQMQTACETILNQHAKTW